jgi:hypothetical protein
MLVRLLDVDLHEGARQLLLFPWSSRLARPQPHDHVFPADRLAWVQGDVLDDAVALVEDAEHRGALNHRRHPTLAVGGRGRLARGRQRRVRLGFALAAAGERKRDQQRGREPTHAYSGIQGS